MTKITDISLALSPEEAYNLELLEFTLRKHLKIEADQSFHFKITRQSIDARNKKVIVNTDIKYAFEPFELPFEFEFDHKPKAFSKHLIIVGSGPAGLFAALRCLELGIKPIIIERGSDVRARRRDLAAINKDHIVNPESNYCFGEGGAGTYSDGKLYTRSKKRGQIRRILELLVKFGSTPNILVDAHPHIGTNKLPQVVSSLRDAIITGGGEVHFNTCLTDILISNDTVKGVIVDNKTEILADGLILATGHSARDIFHLLHRKNILIEAKPFAIGVRVEHQQQYVDSCQYHNPDRGLLPAASYSLVAQTQSRGIQRGVFSFCMCPGGFIVPASTAQNELVVNGMSPSRRDSRFANSGIVVAINEPDWRHLALHGPLAALAFQQEIEQKAFSLVSKHLNTEITQAMPGQLITDFMKNQVSKTLHDTSYQPGLVPFKFSEIFPKFIYDSLQQGFKAFNNKMRHYDQGQVIGIESRTSSPVRIPRLKDTFEHPHIKGLFPCGEGAGYAGGIVSAAMDGERCAEAFSLLYN